MNAVNWLAGDAVLRKAGKIDKALRACGEAIALEPDNARGLHLEAVRAVGNAGARVERGRPAWDGSSALDGKRILVYSDAGFGDAIQFVRYAELLRLRGAGRVLLICQPELRELFRSAAGVS